MNRREYANDYTNEEWDALAKDKTKPYYIYHRGDWVSFYMATEEERKAWNEYAIQAAAEFDADPSLDSYDSHHTYSGIIRDNSKSGYAVSNGWVPPLWFPEWLAQRNGTKPLIMHTEAPKE